MSTIIIDIIEYIRKIPRTGSEALPAVAPDVSGLRDCCTVKMRKRLLSRRPNPYRGLWKISITNLLQHVPQVRVRSPEAHLGLGTLTLAPLVIFSGQGSLNRAR